MDVKVKEQFEELQKNLEAQIGAKALTAVEPELKAIKEQLEAIKNKEPEVQKSTIDELTQKMNATIAAFDELQKNAKFNPQPEVKKSFDENLKAALEEKTDDLNKFARKEVKSVSIELKAVGDITTSNVDGSRYGSILRPGIIEQPMRKVHVRSLLTGGTVGAGNTYTFMREEGAGEGNPSATAEGAVKPQFDADLKEASVNIETIAGWTRFTRKAMNNIPGFISWLQRIMPERLLKVEDDQLLYGDGSTPNIKGILTSGNFTASTSSAIVLVEKIMDDIAQLEDSFERTANGILMRPADVQSFYKNKASGSGEYDLPMNVAIVNGQLFIGGVPVFSSTAVTSGDYVVGDWANGAQFLTQEGMRIEFFEQDGDNVRYNKVTARIEETVALPVYGSNYFIKGSI